MPADDVSANVPGGASTVFFSTFTGLPLAAFVEPVAVLTPAVASPVAPASRTLSCAEPEAAPLDPRFASTDPRRPAERLELDGLRLLLQADVDLPDQLVARDDVHDDRGQHDGRGDRAGGQQDHASAKAHLDALST